MGVLDDASVGQFSDSGAMRRIRIFVELGDVADPEAQRLFICVERADVFPASAEVLPAAVGGREDLLVLV